MSTSVLIAGFQHETNTFAPTLADWSAFTCGACFPPVRRGAEVLAANRDSQLPVSGFIARATALGWQLSASVWAGANPSAQVTEEAFERISAMLLDDIDAGLATGRLDAVYLDLHGAAVCTHVDDPEGELLRRVRTRIGPDRPLVASLDLHANVSDLMLAAADALIAYRAYPHVDMAEAGGRAADALARRLTAGQREPMSSLRVPFLIPLSTQCTLFEPARGVYAELARLEAQHGVLLNFATGFPAADVVCCGPRVWAHGANAQAAVDALTTCIVGERARWRAALPDADTAVAQALALLMTAPPDTPDATAMDTPSTADDGRTDDGRTDGPVVIADTQDNPGAGGDSNTTGLLHALLRAGAGQQHPDRVALGLLCDPQAAAAAHAAGPGAVLDIAIGQSIRDWAGRDSEPPVPGPWTVRAVHAGDIVLKGPMSMGGEARLGLCARLEREGIQVVVSTGKTQMLDRELYRALGIVPETMALLVNKSSVHFRADFAPIARAILVAKATGPMPADPGDLPWTRLDPAIATRP
ncbi:MAG: hypothetical protein RLZZ592_2929 [Pseudomonadota bacterium]|jgi:microcystin degradation protein MlrC